MLPDFHRRLRRVQIEHQDWRVIIHRYDSDRTLFYVDPPYIHATRKSKHLYDNEMTDADHVDLVNTLLCVRGLCMLSGYQHDIYRALDVEGWHRMDFRTACYAAGRTNASGIQGKGSALARAARVESVLTNYTPAESRQMDLPIDWEHNAEGGTHG